jgi:hypothetical protein
VAETTLHTIRFKDGDIEFEMTSSPEEVARVWSLLEATVSQAFASDRPARPQTPASMGGSTSNGKKPRKQRRKATAPSSASASSASGGARDTSLDALLAASVEDFPEIGKDPSALIAGLATLSWARNSLQIDGLTISEIHKFLSQKWRLSFTAEAYRFAFKQYPRMFQSSGRPTVYKLMSRGETALNEHIQEASKG